MRLGMTAGYSGAAMGVNLPLILEAEKLGFDSVWTAEAYGSDAITPLAWIGAGTTKIKLGTAIMQMPARTPAMAAMTAMTLDALSGGRFIIGLGPSGPQVVEGWHGVPYGKPLTRTKEYIQIIKKILAREGPLEFKGEEYQIPYTGPGASGLGKPLKSILHARKDIPIFTASINPKGIVTSAQVADGVIPVWMNPERMDLLEPHISEGLAKSPGKKREDFAIAPFVTCVLSDDAERARMPVKGMLALYIGGMGARGKNFYNELACRYGFEAAAKKVQDLYLDGKKAEATAAVPNELADEVSLVGPPARIRDRLAAWRESGATTLICGTRQAEAMRTVVEAGG
jgi:F420-dependent oxidoreductase-like protein